MELVFEHIKDFIPRLGYAGYSWDFYTVVLSEQQREKTISAQNEYFYLVPKQVIEGIEIISDTEYLKTDEISTADPNVLIQAFTGNIQMSIPQNTRQVLVFIHVIPYTA